MNEEMEKARTSVKQYMIDRYLESAVKWEVQALKNKAQGKFYENAQSFAELDLQRAIKIDHS